MGNEQRESLKLKNIESDKANNERQQLMTINEKLEQNMDDLHQKFNLNELLIRQRDDEIICLKQELFEKDQSIQALELNCNDLSQELFIMAQQNGSYAKKFETASRHSVDFKINSLRSSVTTKDETFDIFKELLTSENANRVRSHSNASTVENMGFLSSALSSALHSELDSLNESPKDEVSELKSELSELQKKYNELISEKEDYFSEESEENEYDENDVYESGHSELSMIIKRPLIPKNVKPKLGFWDLLLAKCQCVPVD